MKNPIKTFIFLFYKYYSTGTTKDIPYLSALCALFAPVLLNIFTIFVILGKGAYIIPFGPSHLRWYQQIFLGTVYFLPLYFVFF